MQGIDVFKFFGLRFIIILMKQYRILYSGSCILNYDILLVEFYYGLDIIMIVFFIDLVDGEQFLEIGSAMQRGVFLIKVMKNDKLV